MCPTKIYKSHHSSAVKLTGSWPFQLEMSILGYFGPFPDFVFEGSPREDI